MIRTLLKIDRTHLIGLVEDRKPVPRNEDGALPIALLSVNAGILDIPLRLLRQAGQLVDAVVRADSQDHRPLRWVEAERPRGNVRTPEFAHAQQANICPCVEIVRADVLVAHVVERILVHGERGPLPLELEHNQTGVMTGGEEIEVRVGGQDPEAVVLAPECLDRSAFCEVPHAHRLVLTAGHDQLVLRVE